MSARPFFVLLLLHGCEAPAPEETAPAADDTAVVVGPAPFDLDIERGACDAMVDPWVAADARAAVDAGALTFPDGVTLATAFATASARAEGGCPTVDTVGGTTLSGTCTTSTGWSYAGTAWLGQTEDGSSTTLWFEDFSLLFGEGDDLWRFSANGGYVMADDGAVHTLSADLVYGLERAGTLAGPGDAYVSLVGDWSRSEEALSGASYARVLSSPTGVGGDLCAYWDQAYDATCDAYLGTVTLDGASEATLASNAETCDDCVEVTLDGVFAGTACE